MSFLHMILQVARLNERIFANFTNVSLVIQMYLRMNPQILRALESFRTEITFKISNIGMPEIMASQA